MRHVQHSSPAILVSLMIAAAAFAEPPLDAAPTTAAATASAPVGWRLSGGVGEVVDLPDPQYGRAVRVTGDGTSSNWWWQPVGFEPGGVYNLRFSGRRVDGAGGGAAIAGPVFANRDFAIDSKEWGPYGFVFATPREVKDRTFRLGQWHVRGSIDFATVTLEPVQPVHSRVGSIKLGAGERTDGKTYVFFAPLDGRGSNYSRPLASFSADFNSNRWVFGPGADVVYRHVIAGARQETAHVDINVHQHTRGACVVEVSTDGRTWAEIGRIDRATAQRFEVPKDRLPAEPVWVRLRADGDSAFQINAYAYAASLDVAPPSGIGTTHYVELNALDPGLDVHVDDLGVLRPGIQGRVSLSVTNRGDHERTLVVSARTAQFGGAGEPSPMLKSDPARVAPGQTVHMSVPITVESVGSMVGRIDVFEDVQKPLYTATWQFLVPMLYSADYGAKLPGGNEDVALWWSDATRKIDRQRPVPSATSEAVQLMAARNEFEAAQIVVRATRALQGLSAAGGALRGPGGAVIDASNVTVLRVRYVPVRVPTDYVGCVGDWPDPLPPLDKPIDVAAGSNQPLWVLVRVPEDAAAGDYAGTLRLSAQGWSADVPLRLHVWGFALPRTPYTQSAFGLSTGTIYQYQGLRREADQRAVFDKYMESFRDHRISPYDPVPFDAIQTRFLDQANPPRTEVNFGRFDDAMQRAIDEWHITSFQLPVPGMGGGTFHSRNVGQIAGYEAGTPQYEAMFASMIRQMQDHLREKGWLDKAYVYWFDEPDPKDYEFVREGMERIHKDAPGIRRMLTEQPAEALFGAVDLWCPITPAFDPAAAAARQAKGEHFWWYVCTAPKAPYCTLFIDHPATELRVWLWQTWQHKIDGILVWQSAYWTSSAAFPDSLQNPYDDPMAYVSGYSLPAGRKEYWGNGDGRFLYPPEAAAGGSAEPLIAGPVSSIRWEMLREGIEDVDYLHLLEAAIDANKAGVGEDVLKEARALLTVPPEITSSMTAFTVDSTPIYARRRAVAEMIERLTKPRGS